MSKQAPGLVLEMTAGEKICLNVCRGLDSEKITLTLESKSGQKARVRIQASQSVRVGKPVKPHT